MANQTPTDPVVAAVEAAKAHVQQAADQAHADLIAAVSGVQVDVSHAADQADSSVSDFIGEVDDAITTRRVVLEVVGVVVAAGLSLAAGIYLFG
jgi:hypothetical protein